ncbi:MAG: hypothetical protein U5J95_00965 [Balneolaceae bacterium]|nr:hypothetical protein [Balneolaceae bacterium]
MKRFVIFGSFLIEFTVETGELTPTLKVKRRIIEDKYGHLIEDIFTD